MRYLIAVFACLFVTSLAAQCVADYDFGDDVMGIAPDISQGETFNPAIVGEPYVDILHMLIPEFVLDVDPTLPFSPDAILDSIKLVNIVMVDLNDTLSTYSLSELGLQIICNNNGDSGLECSFLGGNQYCVSIEGTPTMVGNFRADITVSACTDVFGFPFCNEQLFGSSILNIGVEGCMDTIACNYNPEAVLSDGSCEYAEEGYDCLGDCVVDAEMYYDCLGNCLVDTDEDGVCDVLETYGCTDDTACNYDETASENDGNCIYAEDLYDCFGLCVNDADGDGVCDEWHYCTLELVVESVTSPTCFGDNDGSLVITSTGAQGADDYYFGIDDDIPSNYGYFNNLVAGNYYTKIIDGAGCEVSQWVNVPENEAVTLTATLTEAISCFDMNDATIEVSNAMGGSGSLEFYLLGSPETVSSNTVFSDLGPGAYTVVAIDENGCSGMSIATSVNNPTEVHVMITNFSPASCADIADGIITCAAWGGAAPSTIVFTVDGVSGLTSPIFVSAGTYNVIATDVNGCSATSEDVVIGPDVIVINSSSSPVACTDDTNGSISWAPVGGVGNFTVMVGDSVMMGSSMVDLAPGIYNIIVTDGNGCTNNEDVEVMNATPIVVVSESTSASCSGLAADGVVVVSATGGTGSFQYSENGNTFYGVAEFDGLSAGDYTFYVQDENGCVVSLIVTILESTTCLGCMDPEACNFNLDATIEDSTCFIIAPPTPQIIMQEDVGVVFQNEPGTFWYESETASDPISISESFEMPFGLFPQTIWAANSNGEWDVVGGEEEPDFNNGQYHDNNAYWMSFDVFESVIFESVEVYSEQSALHSILILDTDGTIFSEVFQELDEGWNEFILNVEIPAGEGYGLRPGNDEPFLWRDAPEADINYPYEIGSLASIVSNNYNQYNYYYFFYNWHMHSANPCLSERVEFNVVCINDSDGNGICDEFEVEGCTDDEAVNYNPEATENDSSCIYEGCIIEVACNYNPEASIDDGSCIFFCSGCTDETACNYDSYFLQDDGSCVYPGCMDMNACNYNVNAGCDDDNCQYFDECGECGGIGTLGCNEPIACNYDISADCDDMSCVFSGCMDSVACNYDANAGCDDGACEYASCTGCMYELACNYDSEYTIADNASCEFGICPGCTDSTACNYNPTVSEDDGSCEYCSCNDCSDGCTNTEACNYDSNAISDDGSCLYIDECGECGGEGILEGDCDCNGNVLDASGICGGDCEDDYNSNGVCDDQEVYGCTYIDSPSFDASATVDDGSCVYYIIDNFCPADLDYNGTVGTPDLLLFLSAFGGFCG